MFWLVENGFGNYIPPRLELLQRFGMSTSTQELLESFDRLPDAEKREVWSQIMRRSMAFDFPSMADEDLLFNAEQVFLELDRRETEDGHSKSG